MKIKLLYIALFMVHGLMAQWEDATVQQLSKDMTTQSKLSDPNSMYSFRCSYNLFEYYDDQTPKLTYQGYFIKHNKHDYYYEQFGRVILQNQQFKLTVDSAEQMIVLSEPDSMFLSANGLDVNAQQAYFRKIQRKAGTDGIKYSFTYQPGTQYSGSELWIGTDQYIKKMILYASQSIENGEENPKMIKPRMEINFYEYRFNPKNAGIPPVSKYVTITPGKVQLAAAFTGYELIDLRKIEKR